MLESVVPHWILSAMWLSAELIAQAHLLVDGTRPGTLDRVGLDTDSLWALSLGLVVVRISDSDTTVRCATAMPPPLTLQAASGWVNNRDLAGRRCGPAPGSPSTSQAGTARSAP